MMKIRSLHSLIKCFQSVGPLIQGTLETGLKGYGFSIRPASFVISASGNMATGPGDHIITVRFSVFQDVEVDTHIE